MGNTERYRRPLAGTGWLRRARFAQRRLVRSLDLSQRFLIVAPFVIAVASLVLGLLVNEVLRAGVLEGVARTASSSVEALIYHHVKDLPPDGSLSAEQRTSLDEVIALGSEADSTRLLQFDLRRPDGTTLYLADAGLKDTQPVDVDAAIAGREYASLVEIALDPVGTLGGAGLQVLRITMPITRPADRSVIAVATLYFSTRALLETTARAQQLVSIVVLIIGLLVIAALYAMVARASRIIVRQREHLASNLGTSRQLTDDNRRLRLAASTANESLLARVGSDLHDGPLQLLTLLVLRLSGKTSDAPGMTPSAVLAQDAIDELRNISTGLVLPELSGLDVEATLRLAVERHTRSTGNDVTLTLSTMPRREPMALKICAYRIVQESLTNGYRHGGKGKPLVTAEVADEVLLLTVETPSSGKELVSRDISGQPLGLAGMRLRVEALGGTLSIEAGETVAVRARLPISPVRA